ncbi:MAG TPA: CoA transferase [Acidimicrobiales bacterium]
MTTALDGVRVLDATTGVAGAYCAKLLTDLGADVVVAEPPGGAPLRRWSTTGSTGADGHPDGAFFRFLRAGQRSVTAGGGPGGNGDGGPGGPGGDGGDRGDDLDALIAGADIVLGVDPERVRALNPTAVAVTIDPFGAGNPRAGEDPGDFLLQALSGSLSARGAQDGSPVYVNEGGGRVGEYVAAMFGAAGALAARLGGGGDAVDVSVLEAQALCLVNYPTVTASFPHQNAETVRWLSIPGVEPCADGYVGFFVVTGQQWLDFLTMIERPDLGEDEELLTMPGRMARKDELLPVIREWTRARTAEEITELAALFRVPAALIGRGETMPHFDHLVERGSFTTNPAGGFVQPASPFRMAGSRRPEVGEPPAVGAHDGRVDWAPRTATDGAAPVDGGPRPNPRPLAGLRVLDLTTFWAGPIATQLLAALGADVVRIESIQRPDPQRYNTRVPRTEPQWYETAPVFVAPNLGKREVTLNLSSPRGREVFEQLLATADLVVENYTPRVLDNFGLTYERMRAVNPGIVLVRMPAFGLDGPWRDRPGFAQTVSQAGGMCWTTGPEGDPPMNPGPVCDPLAGIHAMVAALAALEQRRRTGEGQLIEVPMIDVVLNVTAEQTIEHSAYGRSLGRDGNRGPHAAPQGAYRCGPDGADDWIAVAVRTDDEWAALAKAVGQDAWLDDPELATAAGRRAAADRIDAALAAWCAGRDADAALAALRDAGVPAEPVVPAHLADRRPELTGRGFFEEVDHPVVGPKRYPSLPFRLRSRGDEPWHTRPAPLLGQHNDEVLGELGLDAEALARLREEQVIGEVPLGL